MLSENLSAFIKVFSKLPGVGGKTAERLGFYLLSQPESFAEKLAESILTLRKNIRVCAVCGNLSDNDPCPVCSDDARDTSVICVVETPLDVYVLEDSHAFTGLYHVLGGVISPLDGVMPEDLSIKDLLTRIKETGAKEIVLALSSTTEGDTTALYLKELFKPLSVKVTHLARGIPVGTDLQFAGQASLVMAMKNREELD